MSISLCSPPSEKLCAPLCLVARGGSRLCSLASLPLRDNSLRFGIRGSLSIFFLNSSLSRTCNSIFLPCPAYLPFSPSPESRLLFAPLLLFSTQKSLWSPSLCTPPLRDSSPFPRLRVDPQCMRNKSGLIKPNLPFLSNDRNQWSTGNKTTI